MNLRIDGLFAGYGPDADVLKGISVNVQSGQLVGLIGPNGAGKSTLLRTICGFVRPRSGRIELDRRSAIGSRPDEMFARGVGYLMEGHSVFPGMTVEENLILGTWRWRQQRQRIRAALEEVYERAPMLRERRSVNAGLLSGGQQRILELERLYMTRPSLILLDEPSLGLAPKLAGELLTRIMEFHRAGTTVVLVDQNARRIAEVADYVYVMQLGRIRREGPGSELLPEIESIVREFI
jgi:branched-chain amino acid transport system ATP-binding protein